MDLQKAVDGIKKVDHSLVADQSHELALSVLEGLSKRPKGLPSRLFYDDMGSDLFQQIMGLDEYYPTRCEAEILSKHVKNIADHVGSDGLNLVELGCGDGKKTMILLDYFNKQNIDLSFVPLDISKAAIESLLNNVSQHFGSIPFEVQGLEAEYFEGLQWLSSNQSKRNVVLFLGSNIGNFNKPTAMRFLRQLWHSLNDKDYILIGFDLKKDLDVLYDAYNDKKGVTKEFNFNVLRRINKELGADFKVDQFQHQGLYNIQTGAMESYLISQVKQEVNIEQLGKRFMFDPWEAIHMEYSYKYLEKDIEFLAEGTGYEIKENFSDEKGYFIDSLWEVKK